LTTAYVLLEDGARFDGEAVAAPGPITGEVVFTTGMSGYQEAVTDPSFHAQIITCTYPHIGNYGVSAEAMESDRVHARAVIMREAVNSEDAPGAERGWLDWLEDCGVPGISGVDTRGVGRLLCGTGAMSGAFGAAPESQLRAAALAEPGTDGIDLVAQVTTPAPYTVGEGGRRIVAYDFGIKFSIIDHLATLGTVTVVPAATTAEEVLALSPDGVFLSNGPGDPAEVGYAVDAVRELVGRVPVFGICLGHQLLSRALGGDTFKLPFGHHGGNHPVRHEASGRIEITSQNHNFCVDPESLGDTVEVTHVNLNDLTNEGMYVKGQPAFSVQYHPEAGPGPHDANYLFGVFDDMISDPAGWRSRPIAPRLTPPRNSGLPAPERGVA